jgi:SAM-dependent methyltransferase
MNNAVSHQLQVPLSKLPTVAVNGADPISAAGLGNSSLIDVQLDDIARLEGILRDVDDLSSLSPELLQRAIQAGCWYHVTPFRSNLVRALDIPPASRVLEVGCGGGALTRFLGEAGYQVVALETDERLVECARLRCRELSNVEILEGFVEQVVGHEKFDFVVCVDPKLVESEFFDPGVQLLTMCRKVLKATGTLVFAVGNKLASSGAAHVECSRDHTRGSSVTLESLRRSLGNAGFVHSEGFMTFPNHASPQLVVDCSHSEREQGTWSSVLGELYQHSEVSKDEMQKWWAGVALEGIEMHLAPGWLILAHSHHVHSVLWGDASAKFFPVVCEEVKEDGNAVNDAIVMAPTVVETGRLLKNILKAHAPAVNSVRDFKNSLLAADAKMEELANRESDALDKLHEVRREFDDSRTRHTEQIKTEQEARRIREAEMGLVLKQYHAVGAMCHDMREEGRKLKDMLEELRRRYSASEEWGNALLKRLSETEHDLQVARSSLPFRMLEKVKRYFSKPVSARASLTPQGVIAETK